MNQQPWMDPCPAPRCPAPRPSKEPEGPEAGQSQGRAEPHTPGLPPKFSHQSPGPCSPGPVWMEGQRGAERGLRERPCAQKMEDGRGKGASRVL